MKQKTVFISHSTQNDVQVDRIAVMLEDAGFDVWVDHRNGITPGTPSWDKAIRQAIDVADVGLFVMSEASLASDICGSECLLVRELGDPLYILKLEDVKPVNVWLYIKQIQYADLTQDFDTGMDDLIRTLKGETVENAPQALHSKFTGESILRQYLPYLFLNPMHGRDDDLRQLRESLNGVVQVTGTGGLGKSRLVAEIALQHEAGAVWYRCSAVSSPADLLGLLMEHLRLAKDSTEQDVLDQLRLRPGTLIVIDNAEDVPPERYPAYLAFIAKLQTTGAHIVLTSRVRWETIKPLKEITPRALDLASATAIAQDFAQSQNIPLTKADARSLAKGARLYPKLIEWAIGQMGKGPFARVLAQVQELKSKQVQEALDEMIRRSLQQMSQQEGDSAEGLLMRLAVCQGTFDYEVAVALKPDELDEDEVDDALDVLQAWRFVRFVGRDERYSVDAMARLALPPPDDSTQRIHFTHYHDLHSDYDANNNEDRHPQILLDWENTQTALNWGFENEAEQAVDWVNALQYFMLLRRTHEERLMLLEDSLTVANKIDYRLGEANCLKALGDVHRMKNEYAEAVDRYEQALPLYRTIGDRLGEANCLKALGDVHRMKNEYAEAVGCYQDALRLGHEIDNLIVKLNCLQGLGLVAKAQGNTPLACQYYRERFMLSDTHPYFRNSPTTQAMREAFGSWGCEDI